MTARVLVVEDAEAIRTAVLAGLAEAGFVARGRADGRALEDELEAFRPDLVVLDIMLPGRDGFALLDVVRRHSDAGVVMLTARDAVDDRLRGLHGGADDYVVKPFALAELVARVTAVLRRTGRTPSTVEVGDLLVDVTAGSVRRGGVPIELTATELRLLDYLAAQRGRVVSKAQILTRVWGYTDYDPNLVEVHVSALRRKLGEPRLVHTVRGLGYVLRTATAGLADARDTAGAGGTGATDTNRIGNALTGTNGAGEPNATDSKAAGGAPVTGAGAGAGRTNGPEAPA